jgi:hypothetical protein
VNTLEWTPEQRLRACAHVATEIHTWLHISMPNSRREIELRVARIRWCAGAEAHSLRTNSVFDKYAELIEGESNEQTEKHAG